MSCFKIVEPFTVAGSKNAGSEVKAFLNFLLISDLDGHDCKKSMAVLGNEEDQVFKLAECVNHKLVAYCVQSYMYM